MKFSLRALFVATTAIAVYVTVLFALPSAISIIFMFIASYFLGPVILTGVIYDRGSARTFWIGCLVPGAIPYLWMTYYVVVDGMTMFLNARAWSQVGGNVRVTHALAFSHLLIVLSGVAAVLTRWVIIERRLARAKAVTAGATPCE